MNEDEQLYQICSTLDEIFKPTGSQASDPPLPFIAKGHFKCVIKKSTKKHGNLVLIIVYTEIIINLQNDEIIISKHCFFKQDFKRCCQT